MTSTIPIRWRVVLVAWLLAGTLAFAQPSVEPLAAAVDAVNMTVSDLNRAVDFYTRVLYFEKISDTEVAGESFEHLEGVFGLRMRVARLRLGDEYIELTEYLAPKGFLFRVSCAVTTGPFSISPSSSLTWTKLMPGFVRTRLSTLPQDRSVFLIGIRMPRAYVLSTSKIPTDIRWKSSPFPPTKARKSGIAGRTSCSWVSITPRSW